MVLLLGSLGTDSTEDKSPAVIFHLPEIWTYFWQLGDMLPTCPGDSQLPSTMTYLWLNIYLFKTLVGITYWVLAGQGLQV